MALMLTSVTVKNVNGGKIFFLLLRFPLGGAADHLVWPESPFEHNKDVWTLVVKIKGAAMKIEADLPT